MLTPLKIFLILFMCITVRVSCLGQSAQNIWTKTRQSTKKTSDQLQKAGSRIKRYSEHLRRWGMDTSFKHGVSIGARLNTTGWTGLLSYQRRENRTRSKFLQLSFSELVHEKQVKQQRENKAYPALGNASAYVFGKINNIYQLQLGYGIEQLLLPGLLEGNISIGLRLQAGLSIALVKPYYLKLIYVEYNPDEQAILREEKYSEQNMDQFLKSSNILGAAKWKKGIDEMEYLPGGYLDAAVTIEPMKNKSFIKTVSLGCNVSLQTKKMGIMADQKAYPWNACLYAGLNIGKRWK